jgi:hypothetical protein
MRLLGKSLLAVLATSLFAAPGTDPSGLPPGVLLLSRVKRHVNATLNQLPSYACLENVTRLVRESPKKPIHDLDALRFEVAVVHGRELYSWPDDQSSFHEDIPIPGLTSTGQFFSTAKAIFDPASAADIHYAGQETLNGAPAARYDYSISSMFYHAELNVDGRTATVGISGSFWADPVTASLLRLTEKEDDIPVELDTRSVTTLVDYARLLLGGRSFTFPQFSVVTLTRANGSESQNRIEFTHCRQYSVESRMSPTSTPAASTPAPKASASVEFQIPPGMMIPVGLSQPIQVSRLHPGDPIYGVLNANLTHDRKLIAPKGAVLTGRVRVLIPNHDFDKNFLTLGCEFTGLSFTDSAGLRHHAPFYAYLRDFSDLPGVSRQVSRTNVYRDINPNDLWIDKSTTESLAPPELPGVATLFLDDFRTTLPKGFVLDWVSARFPHNH